MIVEQCNDTLKLCFNNFSYITYLSHCMENIHFIVLLFLQLWREGLRKYENYGTNF